MLLLLTAQTSKKPLHSQFCYTIYNRILHDLPMLLSSCICVHVLPAFLFYSWPT